MKEKNGLLQKIVGAVGIALCVVFVPLLLINVTLIVKSYTSPDKVPDFFGYKPFIVLSGSMEPSIMTGDMVFVKETDPDSLKVGDVIAYKSGSAVVTHRSEVGERRDAVCHSGRRQQRCRPGNGETGGRGRHLPETDCWCRESGDVHADDHGNDIVCGVPAGAVCAVGCDPQTA